MKHYFWHRTKHSILANKSQKCRIPAPDTWVTIAQNTRPAFGTGVRVFRVRTSALDPKFRPALCTNYQGRIKHLVGPTHFTMPGALRTSVSCLPVNAALPTTNPRC